MKYLILLACLMGANVSADHIYSSNAGLFKQADISETLKYGNLYWNLPERWGVYEAGNHESPVFLSEFGDETLKVNELLFWDQSLIGFVYKTDEEMLYSQPELNGGVDHFISIIFDHNKSMLAGWVVKDEFSAIIGSANIQPVPIPSGAFLFGSALLGLTLVRRHA